MTERYTGGFRLLSAATLVGTNLWLASSLFTPVARAGRPIEYVLVSALFSWLAVCIGSSAAALLMLQSIPVRREPA